MTNYDYIKVNLPNDKLRKSEWIRGVYDRSLRKWFPYKAPRPYQKEAMVLAFDWLIDKNKDVVILQAPTGFGKSVFAHTVAMAIGDHYYTSPQLNLIEQVSREFSIPMVKGKQNFICPKTGDLASEAPCSVGTKKGCDTYCDYKRQRDEGAQSDETAITPAFLLRAQQNDSSKFLQRSLAIVDETHNLPKYITDTLAVTMTTREVSRVGYSGAVFPKDGNPLSWNTYLKSIFYTITSHYEKIMDNIASHGLAYDEDEVERIRKLLWKVQFVLSLLGDKRPNVIIEVVERGRGLNQYYSAEFKMIKASEVAKDFLHRMSRKYIFMSATVLHGKQFLRELGLDEQDALFIDITESPIQSTKNGPVVIHDAAWLSRKRYKDGLPDAVKEIAELLDIYNKEKVVVIPASHNLRADIFDGLGHRGYGNRLMTHGAGNNQIPCPGCGHISHFRGDSYIECPKCKVNYHIFERDQIIASFFSSTLPKVMISTYFREGADLKDDLCRCLIIPKIPYPNLGDKLVKTRMAYDQEDYIKRTGGSCEYEGKEGGGLCFMWNCPSPCQLWYRMETVKTLVQMAGRIIRSETDWGSIHILDKSWDNFLSTNKSIIPKWFLNCVVDKGDWSGKKR